MFLIIVAGSVPSCANAMAFHENSSLRPWRWHITMTAHMVDVRGPWSLPSQNLTWDQKTCVPFAKRVLGKCHFMKNICPRTWRWHIKNEPQTAAGDVDGPCALADKKHQFPPIPICALIKRIWYPSDEGPIPVGSTGYFVAERHRVRGRSASRESNPHLLGGSPSVTWELSSPSGLAMPSFSRCAHLPLPVLESSSFPPRGLTVTSG